MVLNLHLLKKELSVAEYEEVMPVKGRRNIPKWQQLPDYVIARCPFCLAKNTEKILSNLGIFNNLVSAFGAWRTSLGRFDTLGGGRPALLGRCV